MRTDDEKILDEQLYEYIEKGDISKIETLLLLGADLNAFNDKGMTAVNNVRDVETLKVLIEKGANINKVDQRGYGLFYHLVWREKDPKSIELMQYMIDNKLVNINENNDIGETIAYFAVQENNFEALKVLVENGIDVNKINKYGRTLLHKCVDEHLWHSKSEMVEYLLEKGANVDVKDNNGNTPLMDSVIVWRKDNLSETLIKYGADVNVVNNEGLNLLHNVFKYDRANLMTNMMMIFDNGFKHIDSKFDGNTFLTYAISGIKNSAVVNFLIDKGCDVNERNNKGQTPLMLLFETDRHRSSNFDKKLIFKLIEKTDDVNAIDDEGKSVLDYVIRSSYENDISIYVKLLEKGAEVDVKNLMNDFSTYRAGKAIKKAKNIVELKKEARKNMGQKKRNDLKKLLIGIKREFNS